MMGSMAAFVLNDTMTKTTGGAVPLFQLLFLRGLISITLILSYNLIVFLSISTYKLNCSRFSGNNVRF